MPGRKTNRTKHRTPCAVTIEGRRHNGFLIDYSLSGLFIQTSAKPRVGQRLDLELTLHGEMLPMHVEVARRRSVPAQLRTVAGGGIGVRILSAPEAFYRMLAEKQVRDGSDETPRLHAPIMPRAASPAPRPASPPPAPRTVPAEKSELVYRVRVKTLQGNRTRMLQVAASSEDAAGRLALDELGEAWKVLEVTRSADG
jgi:hypothetical protein